MAEHKKPSAPIERKKNTAGHKTFLAHETAAFDELLRAEARRRENFDRNKMNLRRSRNPILEGDPDYDNFVGERLVKETIVVVNPQDGKESVKREYNLRSTTIDFRRKRNTLFGPFSNDEIPPLSPNSQELVMSGTFSSASQGKPFYGRHAAGLGEASFRHTKSVRPF
jgi:hypothetical protein